ncbi:unnamed protein product, partial [Anisakis simplex]|uniref:ABC transmembrane type-1 domain-containing protein n=1 Tax=Anisakis simplex TaxID=6269 RepID=A0A0M3J286_ANISI
MGEKLHLMLGFIFKGKEVHRHSYEYDEQYDWVTDDSSQVSETIRRRPFPLQTSSTFANEALNESATMIDSYRNANKPKTSIVWRSLRGVLRGCLYITTMGLYPSDFWQKKHKPRDVRRVDENVAGGDEVAFTRASATSLNRPPRSWIDSISAFSPSDDSVIQQQHQQDQQTYFDGPPPSYDETWEMQEGGSRLAPRISTPLNPTTPRQPAISIRDQQQQQQTPNADGPVLGFLWTILSETLEFWITLYEIVARNIRLVKDKTVNLFSPRDEVVYNLRSRSVRAPSLQRQPPTEHLPEYVSLYRRTLKNVYDMSASALKTMLSIGSSVLLAPVMITTYLVSTAIDKTRHRETVTPLQAATTPSSRSDYMVGRAFGIIADFLYSVVKGFMDLVIFLLNVPMMMFSCIRENTMPLLRRAFTGTDDDVQRSTHAMTTRAMSRGGSAVR